MSIVCVLQCAYKISFKWPLECRFLFAVFAFTHKHQQIAEVKHINQRRFCIELRFTARNGTILVFISVRNTKCEWFHKRNIVYSTLQFEIKFGWRENKSVGDHYDAQFISTSSIIGSKLDGVFVLNVPLIKYVFYGNVIMAADRRKSLCSQNYYTLHLDRVGYDDVMRLKSMWRWSFI